MITGFMNNESPTSIGIWRKVAIKTIARYSYTGA